MKHKTGKFRMSLGGGLLALAAAGALTIGTTLSLFSASESSSTNSFTAGTVTVGLGTSPSVTCNVTGMAPGDSSSGSATGSKTLDPCTYNVKYTGSLSAWLSVDVAINASGTNLYTSGTDGLQFYVKDGSTNVINGTKFKAIDGTDTSVSSGVLVEHILLNDVAAAQNTSKTFSIDYLLPLLAPNALQGASTTITLTFHAVQSANQPLSQPGGTCQVGRQCNVISWS